MGNAQELQSHLGDVSDARGVKIAVHPEPRGGQQDRRWVRMLFSGLREALAFRHKGNVSHPQENEAAPAQPWLNPRAAFTLIEVMMAVAIFGVVFISLYAGISNGLGVIRSSREDLRATQVMLEKMETLRLYSWDQVVQPGFIPTIFNAPFWPSDGTNGLQYHGTMTITNVSFTESYSADMRQVVVLVNWDSGNLIHRRQMRTMISRHGLQNYIY